ncbi:hypothetical protein [Massilia genomosp. 1]|uniref:Anti sigma-E protein RseA N-terminal domain-containing protein n=1 Tax=Massilia genomosp. 1 TaxID=2609280 RepID=A0ABX0MJD6_9BURK|nr:hypothetical protein [Massilia genomosp. 1]NHZ62903.1 hypothetical protein [Massilia genomosp. 1]
MDQQKLRTLVFEKTGVRIDIDDPIFALVALNEAVLAEAVERHVALLDDASADLADQVRALQDAGYLGNGGTPAARPAALATAAPGPVQAAAAQEKRLIAIAGGAALLCAFVVLAGQALLLRPAPAQAPVMVAKELTPAQSAALRDGEKLARVVSTLDPKTRAAIAAGMQKP